MSAQEISDAFIQALSYVDFVSPDEAEQKALHAIETAPHDPIDRILCTYLVLQAAHFTSATNAIMTNHTEHLKLIVNTDDILLKRKDSDGNTLLHIAAEEGNALAVNILLHAGACSDTKNANGKNPHTLAYELRHNAVQEQFREYNFAVSNLYFR